MSVDPLYEQFPAWNPYHYVHNNPINLVDPTGMSAEDPGSGDPVKQPQSNYTFDRFKSDSKKNYEKSGVKDIVTWVSSFFKDVSKTDEDGAVDFYSKQGGNQGQKTTGKVRESVEGDVFLRVGGFAGAPTAGLKGSNAPATVLSEAKRIGEYFKSGMDTAQSIEKAGNEVIDLISKASQPRDTIFSVTGYSKSNTNYQAHPSLNPVGMKNAKSMSNDLLQLDGIDSISIKVKEIKR